jgi:hypothetical protein
MFTIWLHASNIKEIKNSLSEIRQVSGKIHLELNHVWGSEDEVGDENYFKAPEDIAVDKNNNVYIVDSFLHCVKVFSGSGQFIRKIGQKGQGPGDLLSPISIAVDETNRIWINDFGNRRIQCFSSTGSSIATFRTSLLFFSKIIIPAKTKIALFDIDAAGRGKGIIKILNRSGVKIQIIGANVLPPRIDRSFSGGKFDGHVISYDKKTKQYCVAYTCSQMIHLFRETGEHISTIFYDTPINKLRLAWNSKKKNYDLLEKAKNYSECDDMAVDSKGRIFMIITARLRRKNESISMTMGNGGIRYVPQDKKYPKKTDLYWFLVFGKNGKIIAAKELDVLCNGIFIHDNRIFLKDKVFEKVIYEYRYKISDK